MAYFLAGEEEEGGRGREKEGEKGARDGFSVIRMKNCRMRFGGRGRGCQGAVLTLCAIDFHILQVPHLIHRHTCICEIETATAAARRGISMSFHRNRAEHGPLRESGERTGRIRECFSGRERDERVFVRPRVKRGVEKEVSDKGES